MAFTGVYPMDQTQLLGKIAAPTTQRQQSGQPFGLIMDRIIATPIDGATFTSEGVTVKVYLSQQDASAIVQQFNAAGIPCTIDRSGFLVLTGTDHMPTSSDPNVLIALGFREGRELRDAGNASGGFELRELGTDTAGGLELRNGG
jgi:hypothetical protein